MTAAKLRRLSFGDEAVETLIRHANELPNLQLLEGAINNEKRAAMPADWLAKHLPDRAAQLHYRTKHELGDLPVDLRRFEAFNSARRERLRAKLVALLCAASTLVVRSAKVPADIELPATLQEVALNDIQ
jgi:ferric-dicitrate binding protein FerR (iron transport regulator)